jgi:hypothetical protein
MGRAAAAALFLALVVPASASASPTRGDFIRRGDALCAQTKLLMKPIRARAQAAETLPTAQKWLAVASLWADQVRIQEQFTAKFKAIGVPAGDTTARTLRAGLDRGVLLARRVHEGFVRRSQTLLSRALPAYIDFTVGLNRRVHAYGFRVCGS